MHDPGTGKTEGPASDDLSVLVVGEDLARVDRFVSPLRRAGYSVRRAISAPAAGKVLRATAFDMVVLVLPLASAEVLLVAVRKETSASSRTAVIVVSDEALDGEAARFLFQRANKLLPADSSPEDLQAAADVLLRAAPRVSIRASARIQSATQGDEPRTVRVENVSATGMFVVDREPPEVGSVFGFELAIPTLAAPVRGQAQVVRLTTRPEPGEHGVAAGFISFGGDGARRLEAAIFQERAAAGAKEWRTGPVGAKKSGILEIHDAEELAQRRDELAELEPFLESLLEKGLAPRVQAADWYVAAAELGFESLRAFSGILEAVHGGASGRRSPVSQQLTDLSDVRRSLELFAEPKRDVASRVKLLLQMRHSLERLLRALAITGAFGDGDASSPGSRGDGSSPGWRGRGLVAELAAEVQRLLRARRVLRQLPGQIRELSRTRYLVARGALRERAAEICAEYATSAPELGLEQDALLTRAGRKKVLAAADRELRKLDKRIATVHQRVYAGKLKAQATGDIEADFVEKKLVPVLVETLAAGAAFLVRAYSAYKHALELTGTDPRLLDRVAGLAAAVTAAEQRFSTPR